MNLSTPCVVDQTRSYAESLDSGLVATGDWKRWENRLDLTIRYDTKKPPTQITIFFSGLARTVYLRQVESPQVGLLISVSRPAPRVVVLTLTSAARQQDGVLRFSLEVSSPDLPPAFVTTRPWPPAALCTLNVPQIDPAVLSAGTSDSAGLAAASQKARRFFLEYDAATNPFLLQSSTVIKPFEKAIRSAIVEKALGVLRKRTELRGRAMASVLQAAPNATSQGGSFAEGVPDPSELKAIRFSSSQGGVDAPMAREEVAYLSELQRTIIQRHYPGNGGNGTDFAAIGDAFQRFADGQLRQDRKPGVSDNPYQAQLSKWNCEPDSAHLFLFAEFALLAIQYDVDAAFWQKLLPSLVSMQPIYADRYAPTDGSPRFDDYLEKNFRESHRDAGGLGAHDNTVRPDNGGAANNTNRPKASDRDPIAAQIGLNIVQTFPGDFPAPRAATPPNLAKSF